MSHSIRIATGWAFVAYFVAVSTLGTGLHGLAGFSSHEDCHHHAGHSHSGHAGTCGHDAQKLILERSANSPDESEHCAVCEYLAKSLSRDVVLVKVAGHFCRLFRLALEPASPVADWPSLHCPRGPPLAGHLA